MEKDKVIRERHKAAKSRQKSYGDVRCNDLEFEVRDRVFQKVSPMKGVVRFGKNGKLSPQFISPYGILRRVGNTAYKLKLPASLCLVHQVFYVSLLRKCIRDPSFVVPLERLDISDSLSYEEIPVEIFDRKVR
ncbi:uncharacterized protein LOC107853272 [Capsicum annuum]|uniref:uncharacterized protein LOC107853272 n=1 Tax=Capsicum annuum TaxID=4072 RepID=UPI0007BFDDB6|nr:uncharacterized protein LOC107853272 [Capsicum annuum]